MARVRWVGAIDGWTGVGIKLDDGTKIAVDLGKKGPFLWDNADYVFITHAHSDHCNFAIMRSYRKVFCSEDTYKYFKVIRPFGLDLNRCEPVKPGDVVNISGVKFRFLPVQHSCLGACAVHVDDGKNSILITGDWADYVGEWGGVESSIYSMASVDVDYLITEATRCLSTRPDPPCVAEDVIRVGLKVGKRAGLSEGDCGLFLDPKNLPLLEVYSNVVGDVFAVKEDVLYKVAREFGIKLGCIDASDLNKIPIDLPLAFSFDGLCGYKDLLFYEWAVRYKVDERLLREAYYVGYSGHATHYEIKALITTLEPHAVFLHHGDVDKIKKACDIFYAETLTLTQEFINPGKDFFLL